ncbi:MAG: fibrinogen-like YCDxxxxGGGW domain-containing protein, partial [Myxococcota bacterium]|nr:fibrinogen-like YCDxxxxGGGW domain-containing protein [Myxococcota bacterium]
MAGLFIEILHAGATNVRRFVMAGAMCLAVACGDTNEPVEASEQTDTQDDITEAQPDVPGITDTSSSTDTEEETATETDTGVEEPQAPGCDGVAGSDKTYDACGVCGGGEDDCKVGWTLGHLSAAQYNWTDQAYECLNSDDADTWYSCSRNVHKDGCPVPGDALRWGDNEDFPTSETPVDALAACQAIFGTITVPGAEYENYPASVTRVGSVPISQAKLLGTSDWAPHCSVYACETNWCDKHDLIEPPKQCGTEPSGEVQIQKGMVWDIPSWARPPANSGYFGNRQNAQRNMQWASAIVSWRQLHTAPSEFQKLGTDDIKYNFESLSETDNLQDVINGDVPYWLRIFTAAEEWAPAWLATECGVDPFMYEYRKDNPNTPEDESAKVSIMPIWHHCVWRNMLNMFKVVLGDCTVPPNQDPVGACPLDADKNPIPVEGWNLRADPRLLLVYIPGGFRYAEYGLGAIKAAALDDSTDASFEATYVAWFHQAIADLTELMGEEYAHKLVFTGEDFPYSVPSGWDKDVINHLPMKAVEQGISIRNGITENHSSHHYHLPAYGTFVDWSGHVVADEDWVAYDGQRILATEQECFGLNGGCGPKPFDLNDASDTAEFTYEVTRANLISLQARMNYMYVKPAVLDAMPEHWKWVEHNLSQRPEDAVEAWASLGFYRDKFFESTHPGHDWLGRPWVNNTEKYIAQRDVCSGGRTLRGSQAIEGNIWEDDPARMTNIEGRSTDRANTQDFIYFDVHERFADDPADYDLFITYVDKGAAEWSVEYQRGECLVSTTTVANQDSSDLYTARFTLTQAVFANTLPGATDLRIYNGGNEDVEVRMIRLVRRSVPGCGDGQRQAASEACDDGNTTAGDGCNQACEIEEGWSCDDNSPTTCSCAEGWTGVDCKVAECTSPCENGGICVAPNSCDCLAGYSGPFCNIQKAYASCNKILENGAAFIGSGLYKIDPTGSGTLIDVYCDMETYGGGWTIVWASMDGVSAGRPWDPVPTDGMFGADPQAGLVRLGWDDLLAIPQTEHIVIRTISPNPFISESWLQVSAPF